jgi:hypothetical protein
LHPSRPPRAGGARGALRTLRVLIWRCERGTEGAKYLELTIKPKAAAEAFASRTLNKSSAKVRISK